MSYDLFLGPRSAQFERRRFADYFGSRDHYQLSEQDAFYQNPDSGVYFGFEFAPVPKDSQEQSLPVSFNINFFRPSYFILEAELEVSALVRHFGLIVFDPQVDGMEEGEYQSDLLIKGWNGGNLCAFATFLKKIGSTFRAYPTMVERRTKWCVFSGRCPPMPENLSFCKATRFWIWSWWRNSPQSDSSAPTRLLGGLVQAGNSSDRLAIGERA